MAFPTESVDALLDIEVADRCGKSTEPDLLGLIPELLNLRGRFAT